MSEISYGTVSARHPGTQDPAQCADPARQSAAAHVVDEVAALLQRLFRSFTGGFTVRLWNGTQFRLGTQGGAADNDFTLVLCDPDAVRMLLMGRDPLRIAEAYFRGDIEIEGNFYAALGLRDHLHALHLPWRERIGAILALLRLRGTYGGSALRNVRVPVPRSDSVAAHSRSDNRTAVQFHYDISNRFYALWLDDAMVYSCAYFERADYSLEQAQHAKLDHICAKLLLRPGDRLLDIGCGWGALMIHAARHFGVHAHGITLSERQLGLARLRIAEEGLADRVTIELADYRDLKGRGSYDKIASVGMCEHVGLRNLPLYFATVHDLLKPGGLFLNHGITHDVEGWDRTIHTQFINRYVFPDGQLDTVGNIQRGMERAHFEIADVEAMRPHYALTLRHWVARLECCHEQALQFVSEATWRVWRLYMAASALEFEAGDLGVYQILASKRSGGAAAVPLTRRHLYVVAEEERAELAGSGLLGG